jgi:hypothetical protein
VARIFITTARGMTLPLLRDTLTTRCFKSQGLLTQMENLMFCRCLVSGYDQIYMGQLAEWAQLISVPI